MLNFLRKNKESFVVKAVLFVIILSFAAFFGLSSLAPSARTSLSPATVNGMPLSGTKFNYLIQSNMDQLRQAFKDGIPPQYTAGLQRNVLASMINQELVNQDLARIGLVTSRQELIDHIKNSDQFKLKGKFDLNYYEKRFLPGYHARNGSSYESDAMAILAQQHFMDQFKDLLSPEDTELELSNWLNQTKLQYEVIAVPIAEALPEEKTAGVVELKPQDKAQQTFDKWKAGTDLTAWLKAQRLTLKKTPEVSYKGIKAIFGGKGKTEHLQTAMALTVAKPFPEAPIKEGNYYYLIKLISFSQPKERKIDAETLAKLKVAYKDEATTQLRTSYIKDLTSKATIELSGAKN